MTNTEVTTLSRDPSDVLGRDPRRERDPSDVLEKLSRKTKLCPAPPAG